MLCFLVYTYNDVGKRLHKQIFCFFLCLFPSSEIQSFQKILREVVFESDNEDLAVSFFVALSLCYILQIFCYAHSCVYLCVCFMSQGES